MSNDEISHEYERNTGLVIVETFEKNNLDPHAMPGVIIAGHASFSWGKDAFDAVHNAVVLEEVAAMAISTRMLNANIMINPALLDKHYYRKHGKDSYYGQK